MPGVFCGLRGTGAEKFALGVTARGACACRAAARHPMLAVILFLRNHFLARTLQAHSQSLASRRKLALVWIIVLSFLLQGGITVSHFHSPQPQAGTAFDAGRHLEDQAPKEKRGEPACVACWQAASASHFVSAAAPQLLAPSSAGRLSVGVSAAASPLRGGSFDWLSRAPPMA